MSLRSVIKLPSCPHGRLVPRTVCVRSTLSQVHGCVESAKHLNVHARLNTSDGSKVQTTNPIDFRSPFFAAPFHEIKESKHPQTLIQGDPSSAANDAQEEFVYNSKEETGNVRAQTQGAIFYKTLDSKQEIRPRSPERLVGCFSHWKVLYQRLLDASSTDPGSEKDVLSEHYSFADEYLQSLTEEEVGRKWQAMNTREKASTLPSLLIGSLLHSAERTLFLLSSLPEELPRNFHVRIRCLLYIKRAFPKEFADEVKLKEKFKAEIAKLRSPATWRSDDVSRTHLDLLLTWSNPQQCESIIKGYLEQYPFARPETKLPIIAHYARVGKVETALELFKTLPQELLQQSDQAVIRVRDELLKRDVVTKSEKGSAFTLLPQVLALGLRPDASLHQAVLESAISNGLSDVAWDLYHHLKSNDLEVNARSHLILLKDAFSKRQVQGVNEIMTAIHQRDELATNPYLIAFSMNIVRCICFFERKTPPAEALAHILALYDRAYSRAPLYRLRMLNTADGRNGPGSLPTPQPGSLAFTIWSYVLIQRSDTVVNGLWAWIKRLIAAGDQELIAVARLEILYNGLMLFYGRSPKTLNRALAVMQYMLARNLCRPTSRSWSILLCAFLRHGRTEQAERILLMMRLRNMTIEDMDEEYIPSGFSLDDLARRMDTILDESTMPEGIEQLFIEPESLIEPENGASGVGE